MESIKYLTKCQLVFVMNFLMLIYFQFSVAKEQLFCWGNDVYVSDMTPPRSHLLTIEM